MPIPDSFEGYTVEQQNMYAMYLLSAKQVYVQDPNPETFKNALLAADVLVELGCTYTDAYGDLPFRDLPHEVRLRLHSEDTSST